MTDENEMENVNWDEALADLNEEIDPRAARFHIAVSQLENLIEEWGDTPIYAKPSEEMAIGEMELSEEPQEGFLETRLGDITAVPLLGVLARTVTEILHSADEDGPDLEALYESKERINEAVKALLIEGILIANSPEWKERFTKAVEGLN
jgi:Fe-S-cluster formation regulator IscX/YfhJ